MEKPKFSIIVPIYNAESTIARTIETLDALDYANYEVILVNDGSTDYTEEMIQQLVETKPNFQWITTENQGPGVARNVGIERAKGTYVLFLDADDTPNKSILKDYDQIYTNHPTTDLIVSSFLFQTLDNKEVVSEKENLVKEHIYIDRQEFLEDLYPLMNQQLMYVVWNKCYRRDILEEYNIRFKNYKSCEDRIFNLEYYQYCQYVIMNPKVEYTYEFEGGKGITNKYYSNKFSTFQEFYELANKVTNNNNKAGMAALYLKGVVSVILSIIESKDLTNADKKAEMKAIFEDETVREASSTASTDSTIKHLTKIFFSLPTSISCFFITLAGKIQSFSPRLISLLKRKY